MAIKVYHEYCGRYAVLPLQELMPSSSLVRRL